MGLEVSKIFSPKHTKEEIVDKSSLIEFPTSFQLRIDDTKTQLVKCKSVLTEAYYKLNSQMKTSLLDSYDIENAESSFNELRNLSTPINIIGNAIDILDYNNDRIPIFWISSEIIKECYQNQSLISTETIHYGIGKRCSNVHTVEKVVSVDLESSEVTRAKADIDAVRNILTTASRNGSLFTCYFHTHPGKGKEATNKSDTDIKYQSNLERGGYKTIGCIYSRDGYLRFFSDKLDFNIIITGKGVEHVKGKIYKIK